MFLEGLELELFLSCRVGVWGAAGTDGEGAEAVMTSAWERAHDLNARRRGAGEGVETLVTVQHALTLHVVGLRLLQELNRTLPST